MIPEYSVSQSKSLLTALLVVAGYFLLLIPYTAYWGTNDDVRMAMLAGGFGIVEVPGYGLIHSNVIWGWLAANLPAVLGLSGYALLTYSINTCILVAMLFASSA